MSSVAHIKRRLRERSEHYLMQAAMRDLRRDAPSTVEAYRGRDGLLWRWIFVPLYRRLPWALKQRAMSLLRMTASGWRAPERRPGEPWRPPRR
jgi:hypothetical protein